MADSFLSAYEHLYTFNIFWPEKSIGHVAYKMILVAFVLFLIRVSYLIHKVSTAERVILTKPSTFRLIVCVGSGGHTAEMLTLLKYVSTAKYTPRLYIMADNDSTSEIKIHLMEKGSGEYDIAKIPRSRDVNQSYLTSILSTLHSIMYSIPIVYKFHPDAVICNGPGTCVPVCLIAFLLRCLFLGKSRIVFIESICRVRTLSLSGKILKYIADTFIVQWPELKNECGRAEYYGRLS